MLNISNLPRQLNEPELNLIFCLLPENKSAYSKYRKLLSDLYLIGTSRFGDGNYILADKNDKVDLTAPASPIYSFGIVKTNSTLYDIAIHELFENQIELDFISSENKTFEENEIIENFKSYSSWNQGELSPISKTKVREIHLIKNKVIIVISSDDKKIWVNEKETGFNFIIPVTNLYNEIIRVKKEKNHEIAFKPKLIFEKPELFSDNDIGQGFLLYNKFMKKINIDYSIFTESKMVINKKSFFGKIFGKK